MQGAVNRAVAGRNRRRFKRTHALLSGTIFHDNRVTDCVIFNLSLGGAMVRCSGTIADGEIVTLSVSRIGALRGETVWHASETLGLRFLEGSEQVAQVIGDTLPERGFGASLN